MGNAATSTETNEDEGDTSPGKNNRVTNDDFLT